MNTKIAFFIVALAALACNFLIPAGDPTSTPIPTATVTMTPPPSATPAPVRPRIAAALIGIGNSSQKQWKNADLTDLYPHTRIPANVNIVAVSFYLESPVGWPEHATEVLVHWYRDGALLKDWDGSVICTLEDPCHLITSSHFSGTSYQEGRYEVRLYLGEELMEGSQAEFWITTNEWLGDLHVLQCGNETATPCEGRTNQGIKFPEQVIIPAGSATVYVGTAYANLPPGTEWQVELYKGEQVIDSEAYAITREGDRWSGWLSKKFSGSTGAPLEPGTYTLRLVCQGKILETASFEVEQTNGQTTFRNTDRNNSPSAMDTKPGYTY